MPNISQSLQGQDLGHLHIIAELWGVTLSAPDVRQGKKNLAKLLADPELAAEIIDSLPQDAQTALTELQSNANRLLWGQFTRKYGEVREMGAGKRDREHPHRSPTSTTEFLWYRAIVGRAFFDTDSGPKEFAYIPEDLAAILPTLAPAEAPLLSRPATPAERAHTTPANTHILDHATTLLAALRIKMDADTLKVVSERWPFPDNTLKELLKAADLIDKKDQPNLENTRAFLEANRGEALLQLFDAWLTSPEFNDLHHVPHLATEGEWQNDPLRTRRNILKILSTLNTETWWSLPALLANIQTHQPDFQRTAGEYDSWYIKDTRTGQYLRGVEHWEAVDGELLKYLITGPLHWLGITDLGAPEKDVLTVAFRFSKWAEELLANKAPTLAKEEEKLQADSKLTIQAPPHTPRSIRYQIARFCQWEGKKKDNHVYRITPASLEKAKQQGLEIKHLTTLLKKHNAAPLPPNLTQSLERWDKQGTQAHLETMLVLRVNSPDILQALRESRAKRFLGDPLGPTTITVKPGAWQQVMDALGEMGYLVDGEETQKNDVQ